MPRIRNFQLPPNLTEALAQLCSGLPEDLLLSWGRECLPGGFTKYEAIRDRLVARVRSEAALEPSQLQLLEIGLPYRALVAVFSVNALQHLYPALATMIGREDILAAMLVDSREPVHKFAVEQAGKPAGPPPTGDHFELSELAVREFLSRAVYEELGIPAVDYGTEEQEVGPPPDDFLDKLHDRVVEDLSDKVAQHEQTIERLQNELQQTKLRHQARQKELSEGTDREKKKFREDLGAAQARAAAAEKEKHTLANQAKELQSRVDALVAERLQQQTSALIRKWLQEPLKVEAALSRAETAGGQLLQRAAQALEAQARQDRHTGNRLKLQGRIDDLHRIHQQLTSAVCSALVPVPELKSVIAELEHELARLEKQLNGATAPPFLVGRLLGSVNTAGSWDEVRNWSQLTDQLQTNGLLTGEEARRVYNAVQRKFSLLQETDRAKDGEGDTGWSLRDTLFRNKPALLLLDGHNILFGLQDIFGPDYEEGAPRAKARARLVNLVSTLVTSRPNVRTRICFDGPDPGAHPVAPNLEVIYSGGTGHNRADEMIVSKLQFKDLQSLDQKVFVVTDDREVRRGIVRTGAKYVPANMFAVFLHDFKCFD